MTKAEDFIEQIEFDEFTWERIYHLLGWKWTEEDQEVGCPDILSIKLASKKETQKVKRGQSVVFYRGKPIDII